MPATTVLSFEGRDAEECEDFVTAVSRQMFLEGKDQDDEYVARFAASNMARKALRWFILLDHDVQKSWRLLRAALLERYRSSDDEEQSNASTVPVPAAAPAMELRPSSSLPIHATTSNDITNLPGVPPKQTARSRRGHLRINTKKKVFWLTGKLNPDYGYFVATTNPEDALELVVEPTQDGRNFIRLPRNTGYRYLGFVGQEPSLMTPVWPEYALCCAIGTQHLCRKSSFWRRDTKVSNKVWVVQPDGSVQIIWKGNPADFVIGLSSNKEACLYIEDSVPSRPRRLPAALIGDPTVTVTMEWI